MGLYIVYGEAYLHYFDLGSNGEMFCLQNGERNNGRRGQCFFGFRREKSERVTQVEKNEIS